MKVRKNRSKQVKEVRDEMLNHIRENYDEDCVPYMEHSVNTITIMLPFVFNMMDDIIKLEKRIEELEK